MLLNTMALYKHTTHRIHFSPVAIYTRTRNSPVIVLTARSLQFALFARMGTKGTKINLKKNANLQSRPRHLDYVNFNAIRKSATAINYESYSGSVYNPNGGRRRNGGRANKTYRLLPGHGIPWPLKRTFIMRYISTP